MAERPNIFSDTYHYLADVADIEDLSVDIPGIESIAVMSGTSRNKLPFKAIRLHYKRLPNEGELFEEDDTSSPPDKIGPRAVYCFDEEGSDDMMFMNANLLKMVGRLPESGERITATSFGFFLTVLGALHSQHPKLFKDPRPLVEKMVGQTV